MERAPMTFERMFKDEMEDRKKGLESAILNGGCQDHSEYRWYTGQLQGLRVADAFFDELMTKFKEQE